MARPVTIDPPLIRGLEDDSMNARNVGGPHSPLPLSPGTAAEDVEEDLLDPAVGRVVQGGPTVPRGQLRVGPVAHHELDKVEVPGHAESLEGGLADSVVPVNVDGVAGGAEEVLQLRVVPLLNQPLKPLLQHGAVLAAVRGLGHGAEQGGVCPRRIQRLQTFFVDVLVPETIKK